MTLNKIRSRPHKQALTPLFYCVCVPVFFIKMKEIKHIWNIVGTLLGVAVNLKITYDYFIDNKEPSSFLVYGALVLYMQLFLKHKDKTE